MAKQKIDKKLILRVAENARITLSEKEIEAFIPQLQEILDSFEKLDSIDVEKEKPSFQPIPLVNVMRKDEVEKCLTQAEALKNTKNKKDGYFMGPKVT